MQPPIVNLDAVALRAFEHGDKFGGRHISLGALLGAQKLGYRMTALPPGKRAWPFHSHHANEEMFFVLAGRGRLRLGSAEFPIRAGDVVCCRAGGAERAHQIINDSDAELRYLAVSTMLEPDVIEYPDSGKFAAFAGAAPGGAKQARTFEACVRFGDAVDYWDGE